MKTYPSRLVFQRAATPKKTVLGPASRCRSYRYTFILLFLHSFAALAAPAYDHPVVGRSYLFPPPALPIPPLPKGELVQIGEIEGSRIHAYWYRPYENAPTLLYSYGNGSQIASELPTWSKIADDMHVNLMIADYPGFGHSEGKATLSGCARSVNLALDFLLRQSTKDVPKVILVGRSAGSIFAIDAAEKHADSPRVAGLVLESGVADLGQRLVARNVPLERNGLVSKEVFSDVSRDFNHEEKLKKISVPILIMHTEHDTIVPAFNGEKLARWAGPKLQELVLFKKGDHNSIFMENAVAYEQHLKKFIDTQVKKMPETKNQKLPPAQDCLVEIKAFAPRG